MLSVLGWFVVGVCFTRRQSSLKPRPESVRVSSRELSRAQRDARTCSSANPSFQIKHFEMLLPEAKLSFFVSPPSRGVRGEPPLRGEAPQGPRGAVPLGRRVPLRFGHRRPRKTNRAGGRYPLFEKVLQLSVQMAWRGGFALKERKNKVWCLGRS